MFKKAIDWAKAKLFVVKAGQQIMVSAADYMAERARAHAPVDTGFLQNSVAVAYGLAASLPYTYTYSVVATADYAVWVQIGHLTPSGFWVAPNPFMTRAVEDTARAFPQIAKSSMRISNPLGGAAHLTVSIDA